MKTAAWAFSLKATVTGSALLITASALAQPVQVRAPAGPTAQPSTEPGATPRATTSNRWESLPVMSSDRCLAELVGTASDPKTGAPVRASVNPETGKPICTHARPPEGKPNRP